MHKKDLLNLRNKKLAKQLTYKGLINLALVSASAFIMISLISWAIKLIFN
jgi:hypothetical protein